MDKRQCYYIDLDQYDEGKGFVPSLVTEGEPGHSPMRGDPEKLQTPWYWGRTYEDALEACSSANEDLGLTPEDVTEIILSSMRAG